MTLPPGMFPPPPPQFGPQPSYGQHLPPRRGAGGGGAGAGISSGAGGEPSFSDAFDFSFTTYATPALVKISYIILFVVCVAEYVGIVLGSVIAGLLSPIFVIPAILLGWVIPLLTLMMGRMTMENYLATVRTAQEVRALRERADLGLRGARP